MQFLETSIHLIAKALVLSAWWAGQRRRLCLAQAARSSGEGAGLQAELLHLRDQVARLSAGNGLLKQRLKAIGCRKPYPWSPAESPVAGGILPDSAPEDQPAPPDSAWCLL